MINIITITVIIVTIKKTASKSMLNVGKKQKKYIYIRDLFCFLYRRFYIFKYSKAEILKSTGGRLKKGGPLLHLARYLPSGKTFASTVAAKFLLRDDVNYRSSHFTKRRDISMIIFSAGRERIFKKRRVFA